MRRAAAARTAGRRSSLRSNESFANGAAGQSVGLRKERSNAELYIRIFGYEVLMGRGLRAVPNPASFVVQLQI